MMRQSVLAQWMSERDVTPGRNGAPKDAIALSIPRDRADEAPKTSPKGDPKAPIKLIG